MNYKGLLKNVLGLALILFLGIYVSSCGEDEPPMPELTLVINGIDGFEVDIAAEATNATEWSWDYDDENTSETVGGHLYTYTERGDFTIKCTVTGEGGSVTKTVDVHIATVEELLVKTWVLSTAAGSLDGIGNVKAELINDIQPTAGINVLEFLNQFSDNYDFTTEYDNEFTFSADGGYSIDNGATNNVLSGWVYSNVAVPGDIRGGSSQGFFVINLTEPASASWTLHENTDLTIESVFDEDGDDQNGVEESITFEDADYITFGGDGFIALKDYTSTVIIREITTDKLTVTLFWHSYLGDPSTGKFMKPSYILTMTLDAK